MRVTGFRALTGVGILLLTGVAMIGDAQAQKDDPRYTDETYLERFHNTFTRIENPLPVEEYATPERYDKVWMGDSLITGIADLKEKKESIFWGWSYRMMSLNEMYRATRDPKYLKANLLVARTIDSLRDDRNGVALWTGQVAPVWSSGGYTKRGGPAVHPVHTGMLTYPILDLVYLSRDEPAMAVNKPELDHLAKSAIEALEFHAYQWVEGPGDGEGHYVARNQEEHLEGIHLPVNRLNAMGRAHWMAWKLTGDEAHKDKAIKLGWFFKNRVTVTPDGRWVWNYGVTLKAEDTPAHDGELYGEDFSHAALTVGFPALLAADGEVYTEDDMHHLCKTLEYLGRLGDGVLLANVAGKPTNNPNGISSPGRWLRLSPWCPEGYRAVADFERMYVQSPSPLDLALLMRYMPKE